jgi:hypothetical protein
MFLHKFIIGILLWFSCNCIPAFAKELPRPTFDLFVSTSTGSPGTSLSDTYTTEASAVILRGNVRASSGDLSRCTILLNGKEQTTLNYNAAAASIEINAILPLRQQRNEVTLILSFVESNSRESGRIKKSYWITSKPQIRKQWAIIIGVSHYPSDAFETFGTRDAEALAKALREAGITVIELLDSNATRERINAALSTIADSVGHDDSVLVYFSGGGYSNAKSGEPYLATYDAANESRARGLSLTELLWQLRSLHFPSLAVILDTCFVPASITGTKAIERGELQAAPVEQLSAFWLSPIANEPNVTVFLSSRFYEVSFEDPVTQHGLFTQELLKSIHEVSTLDKCVTLPQMSGAISSVIQAHSGLQHPLLFSSDDKNAFCFNRSGVSSKEQDDHSDVRTAPLFSGFDRDAPNLRVDLPRSVQITNYPGDSIRVMFVVSDPKISIPAAYQVANNGQVILRKGWERTHQSDKHQVVTWVQLAEGENRISLQVDDANNRYAEETILVTRAERQSLSALLVGIDEYSDHSIQPLRFASADVRTMKDRLLRFTDIQPAEITTLVDA